MKTNKKLTFGNLLMGIRFSTLIKMVFKNGLGINPVFILRFLFLLPTSLIVEIFILVEKIKFSRKISNTVIEKPPVFIIGHWRSGTTLLHQLIFLDDHFTAPRVIQTIIPEHFLFSTKYWLPVLKKTLPPKRPMDQVDMSPLEPQEDEWALIRLGVQTPLSDVFFPSSEKKFLTGKYDFVPVGKSLEEWKNSLEVFLKKITLQTGKQIVLKNPFHTMRMSLLAEMFPGAKFIHIVRHPYKIVPSAINTWNIVARENAFRGGWQEPSTEETAKVVETFYRSVNEERKKLEKGQFSELRFEDLEKDPVQEIKRIYSELELDFTAGLSEKIIQFMKAKKDYRKNVFSLSPEDISSINTVLAGYMKLYNYDQNRKIEIPSE